MSGPRRRFNPDSGRGMREARSRSGASGWPAALRRAPAPLALMLVVFGLSAQSNLGTDLGLIDLIGRKFVHAGTYAALTLLWWWALRPLLGSRGPALALAAASSFLYGASDEYHQSFVEGRVGSPIDVAIDTAGILIAVWLVRSGHLTRLLAKLPRLRP